MLGMMQGKGGDQATQPVQGQQQPMGGGMGNLAALFGNAGQMPSGGGQQMPSMPQITQPQRPNIPMPMGRPIPQAMPAAAPAMSKNEKIRQAMLETIRRGHQPSRGR